MNAWNVAGTFDARSSLEGARSSMDSADTFRSVPRRSSLRTGNLFGGLLPVNDTFGNVLLASDAKLCSGHKCASLKHLMHLDDRRLSTPHLLAS